MPALSIAGAITGGLALAAPAQATGCSSGSGGFGGGGFCDTDYWEDGSYWHCASVYVLGFGGSSCGRVCPWPDPGNMAPPPPADLDPQHPVLMSILGLLALVLVLAPLVAGAAIGALHEPTAVSRPNAGRD